MAIGGNKTATIQISDPAKNEIGVMIDEWKNVQDMVGWLDLTSGDSKYTVYNAKISESTNVFIADYEPLDSRISAETCRMVIDGNVYDIMMIDDPMDLHEHYEIYLKYIGGQ